MSPFHLPGWMDSHLGNKWDAAMKAASIEKAGASLDQSIFDKSNGLQRKLPTPASLIQIYEPLAKFGLGNI